MNSRPDAVVFRQSPVPIAECRLRRYVAKDIGKRLLEPSTEASRTAAGTRRRVGCRWDAAGDRNRTHGTLAPFCWRVSNFRFRGRAACELRAARLISARTIAIQGVSAAVTGREAGSAVGVRGSGPLLGALIGHNRLCV